MRFSMPTRRLNQFPPDQRPQAYQQQLQNLQKMGIDVSKFPQQYPGDEQFDLAGAGLTGTSERLAALARMKAAGKPPEGEMPLGQDKVGQLNQLLGQRYQVLHPGQQIPTALTLPPDANQKDFDR